MEGFGLRRKILFKIKKNQNNFEATEMTPEFEQERRNFNDYKEALSTLTSALEGIAQPDPAIVFAAKGNVDIAYPEGQPSPLENVHACLQTYKSHVSSVNLTMVEKAVVRAARLVREQQKNLSATLTPLRQFPSTVFERFVKVMNDFDEARNKMDLAKHEVKQSKTTMEIEKKAIAYKESVENFDNYCTTAIQVLEELPKIQAKHANAITAALKAHHKYHQLMADAWK